MRFKRIAGRLLMMLILISGTSVCAQDLTLITEEYPPVNFTKNGNITGSSVEIVREILRRQKQPDNITMLPWARAYSLLKTKANIVLFTTTRIKEREELFHWVGPLCTSTNAFYAKKGSNIRINSIDVAEQLGFDVSEVELIIPMLPCFPRPGFPSGKKASNGLDHSIAKSGDFMPKRVPV
jgi:polar amino acid transport system substrate-binding protein